jgi:hypothetical protein
MRKQRQKTFSYLSEVTEQVPGENLLLPATTPNYVQDYCCGLKYVPPKDRFKLQPSVPENVTLFGKRVSADIIKL